MSKYPFQRLVVYPAYPGVTIVSWDLHPNMQDSLPYTYQLQKSETANPDDEWENVGNAQVNAVALVDSNSSRTGYLLDCFYRVVLTTSRGTYTSEPEGCFGQLHRSEWKTAQEIISKERLLYKKTAVPGVLLQALRNGERCPYCKGNYDQGVGNSRCLHCYGTGYVGGYHKPFAFQTWQVSPSQRNEIHYHNGVAAINMSVDRYQARAMGVPEIYNSDIWIDLSTGQRFRITASKVIAQIRRVPLVRAIDMNLIPASDIAYKIPIGDDNYSSVVTMETAGCGDKTIDHNFPTTDALRYVDSNGNPIVGATITIESAGTLVFSTVTNSFGRWETAFKAKIGDYTIKFEKVGYYGPNYAHVTVKLSDLNAQEQADYNDKQEKLNTNYFSPFNV